jgi:type VI secretion system secreted protein VgrG
MLETGILPFRESCALRRINMPEESRIFHFHSEAVADDTFQVSALTGAERLSEPYGFTLELQSKNTSVPLDKMLTSKAWIAVRQSVPVSGGKRGIRIYKIHGLVSEFEILEMVHEWVKYRAVLVPRLWKFSLNTQSRVFQDMDIKDVIKAVLTDKDGPGLSSQDFDLKVNGSYPKREFIVQYNETDLDFLHRWLEYEGIFYYFEQTESGEKIIFGDGTAAYAKLAGDPKVPYRPDPATRSRTGADANEQTLQEETVHSFRCLLKKTPKQVVLKDYNYRTPSVEIKAKADVENPAGEGKLYVYGEHFKTPGEGSAVAKVRAEEIQCRDKTFDGVGDQRSFRPGTVFTLSEHYRSDFNASYLLVNVRHTMAQGTGAGGGAGSHMNYQVSFDCIPSDDVFRPERTTPWPSIHGFINAKVDAGGSGDYAEIDDQGRYKVKLPFDLSDKKDGKASRFIRMAQPYAGANMGMHFPLHKDAEVLISFVDGDPDRPIIIGSIPNAETQGPVTSKNQSQCAIHTGGGTKMVIEDTDGNQRFHLLTPTSKTFFQMGSKTDDEGGSKGEGGGSTGAPAPGAQEGVSMGTDADINFQSAKDYIHRTGGSVTIETTKNELKITKGDSAEETHGNKREWTKGDHYEETVGNTTEKTTGNKSETTTGNSTEVTTGNTDETFVGTKSSKSLSAESEMTLGAKSTLAASAESEITVGAKMEVFSGAKHESTAAICSEANTGGKITFCEAKELKTANMRLEEATEEHEILGGEIKVTATKECSIEGTSKITLECGGSKIELTPSGITITCTKFSVDASGPAEFKSGAMVTVKGASIKVDGQVMEG